MLKRLFVLLIRFYQMFISPLLGSNVCRFHPSCSQYTILAIKENGIVKGILMGFFRILRCNPWVNGGYDPVSNSKTLFENKNNKI